MADQIAIYLPKSTIDEGSLFTVTARFRDRATATASTPTSVDYAVYNLSEKQTIVDWTSVSANAEVSVNLGPEVNRIRDNRSKTERQEIIIRADVGLSTEVVQKAQYLIRNVGGYEYRATPSDGLNSDLSFKWPVSSVSDTSYTATTQSETILVNDESAGSKVTITLPAASSCLGIEKTIKKIGDQARVVIQANGSETIDGSSSAALTVQYQSLTMVCDGSNWHII